MYKKLQKLLAGSVLAMTTLVAHAAESSSCYIGEVFMFSGNFAPVGTLFANGSLLPIAQYYVLFAIIGTTYGGDGQSTFALPDLRGREAIGTGTGNGLSTVSLGQQRGNESVTPPLSGSATVIPSTRSGSTPVATAGTNVATIPPQLASNYVICTEGIFPQQN